MTTEHPQQSQEQSGHTRRRFLTAASGAAGAVALGPGVASAAPAAGGKRVAVLGGGVSGLSAAQELAERGYAVTVYEYYDALGGKARSMDVPGTGAGGRGPLPGEHGFRFFPGFYRNLPDTMRRIPFAGNAGNADGVRGNLRSGTEALFARCSGRPDLHFPLRRVTTPPRPRRPHHPAPAPATTSPRPGSATRSCPSSTSAPACPPTRPPTSPTASSST